MFRYNNEVQVKKDCFWEYFKAPIIFLKKANSYYFSKKNFEANIHFLPLKEAFVTEGGLNLFKTVCMMVPSNLN